MYNLMIIEKNPYQLDKIINNICKNFQDIRICYIFFDDKNISEILRKDKIDIILLDCQFQEINNIEFIEYIEKNNLYQYKKSIIIKLDKLYKLTKYTESKYVFSYTNEIATVQRNIKSLIAYKNNVINLEDIKCKIKNELIKLNYNYNYSGTKYLEEVILEIYKNKYEFDGNLSKNIYPIIAKRYNKKVDTIYCNIKQATNFMICESDSKKLMNYLGYYDNYMKPKVQEVIFSILNRIK